MRKPTKRKSIAKSHKSSAKKATAKPIRKKGAGPNHKKADRAGNGGHAAHRSKKAPVRQKSAPSKSKSSPNATANESKRTKQKGNATTEASNSNAQESSTPKLQPQEVLDLMYERRDPFGFVRALVHGPGDLTDFPKEFGRLYQVVRRRAAEDPEKFVAEILKSGEGTLSNFLLRMTFYIDKRVQENDRRSDQCGGANVPSDILNEFLPMWTAMLKHLGELTLQRASIERQLELARAKRLENDHLERLLHAQPSPSTSPAWSTDEPSEVPSANEAGAAAPQAGKGEDDVDVEDLFAWNKSGQTLFREQANAIIKMDFLRHGDPDGADLDDDDPEGDDNDDDDD